MGNGNLFKIYPADKILADNLADGRRYVCGYF